MSRTVLLSKIGEVEERYPGTVAEVRRLLEDAGLPVGGDEALQILAERLAWDPAFRENVELHVGLHCAREPEMSHLEVLGLTVVAALGAEKAGLLSSRTDDADHAALRTLFHFEVASGRRRRDAFAAGGAGAWSGDAQAVQEGGFTDVQPRRAAGIAPIPDECVREAIPVRGSLRVPEAVPVYEAVPVREAIPPRNLSGGSAMLARALALAADEEVGSGRASVQAVHGARGVPIVAKDAPRRVRPERELFRSRPVMPSVVTAEAEEAEEAPRSWGMWTAVTCGVLLGFGVGAFAHFEHGAAPVISHSSSAPGLNSAHGGPPRRAKSVEELQAEIAALDAIASLTPAGDDRAASEERPAAARSGAGVRERYRAQGRQDQSFAAHPGAGGRLLTIRSAEAGQPAATRDALPSASASSSASALAPTVAAVSQPGNARAIATPAGSTVRAAGVAPLPQVVTGSAGIMAANLVSSPAPAYPVAASSAGVQGEVVVEAVVGRDGGVVDTRVVSGPPMLRAAALDAVQRWRYRPYEVGGKPIEVATTARLEFRLDR